MDLDLFVSVQGTCGITAHIIIHISMGYQGDGIHVEIHGPLVISGAWVSGMKLFYSTTQDRNISKAVFQDREVPQASLRGESWILDPKIWKLLIKKWHFCLCSRHKLSTSPFSILYHWSNFSATWSGFRANLSWLGSPIQSPLSPWHISIDPEGTSEQCWCRSEAVGERVFFFYLWTLMTSIFLLQPKVELHL